MKKGRGDLPLLPPLVTRLKYCKYYCKNTNIKIVFSLFKVGDLFRVKEPVHKYLRSFAVYRFTGPGCFASYIGETTRQLTTRIKEHLETDPKSHVFKHLNTNKNCRELCDTECFEAIDPGTSSYRLKVKEAMHITWQKTTLNKKINHVFYNYLITYCLSLFHLFYYCYCYCTYVTFILFKITSWFVNVICDPSDCINILDFYYK